MVGSITPTETPVPIAGQNDPMASLTKDYKTFLTMLTTQLKNQDPTSPMDSSQFTNQLVLFAGVEQQIRANTNLSNLIKLQQTGAAQQALNYLGKIAEVKGDQVPLVGGAGAFSYTLSGPADNVKIEIVDANGNVVRDVSGGNKVGKHIVSWDGTDSNNEPVPDGLYKVKITPTRADSTVVKVTEQTVYGVVNSVQTDADGTIKLTMTYLQGTPADILTVNSSVGSGSVIGKPPEQDPPAEEDPPPEEPPPEV
jgi:flagellar basal-body rod modification protein FlgD